MQDNFYYASETTTEEPSNKNFHLHNHNGYEIYMFLQGDAEYIVEEKSYTLSHGDIIIIRKHEMHKVFHTSQRKYRRIVTLISPEFFVKNQCEEFENVFLLNELKTGNKIKSEIVQSIGLYDAVMRLKKYSDNFSDIYTPITKSVLIEILYLLNKVSFFEKADTVNKNTKEIIRYINDNYTDNITLDFLCDKFFISKYYLCHIFKQATGLTVLQYIKEKRLALAIELKAGGMNLTEIASRVGFENYSSFFRAFTKRYNVNPANFKLHTPHQ